LGKLPDSERGIQQHGIPNVTAAATRMSRTMSFLTHATFSVMLLLALLAGLWSHQR
jgi:hypothetical protein